MNNSFYMIYVEGERHPIVKHETLLEAQKEAKRLTSLLGKPAIVLASIQSFKEDKYKSECMIPHEVNLDIPF